MLSQKPVDEEIAPTRWELTVAPKGYGMPTLSPESLLAETALRFCRVGYETQETAPGRPLFDVLGISKEPLPRLALYQAKRVEDSVSGAQNIVDLLRRNGKDLTSNLNDVQLALLNLTQVCCETQLIPCILYLMIFNEKQFQTECASKLMAGKKGWFQFITAPMTERIQALRWLQSRHDLSTPQQAEEKILTSVQALERMFLQQGATVQSSSSMEQFKFYLGGNKPSLADCYVYTAISMLVHGHFGNDPIITHMQTEVLRKCPLLVHYVETIRQHYFDAYAGLYSLKPIPPVVAKSEDDDEQRRYKEGRVTTIVATAVFAALYFVVANAGVIVALLSAVEEGIQPEEGTETPPPGHGGQSNDVTGHAGHGGAQQDATEEVTPAEPEAAPSEGPQRGE